MSQSFSTMWQEGYNVTISTTLQMLISCYSLFSPASQTERYAPSVHPHLEMYMCKQKGAQLEEHARTQLSSDTEEVAEATGSHTWYWLSVTQRGTGGRSNGPQGKSYLGFWGNLRLEVMWETQSWGGPAHPSCHELSLQDRPQERDLCAFPMRTCLAAAGK